MHEAISPGVDDAQLRAPPGIEPHRWTAALAYLKARAGARALAAMGRDPSGMVVLGADTIVVKEGEILGQPVDADDARRIIRRLEQGCHTVMSGAALLLDDQRWIMVDRAAVCVGVIGDARIEAYIASGGWKGKAGGYNLSERLAEGWPISYEGDPACIMGLPMRRLAPAIVSVDSG